MQLTRFWFEFNLIDHNALGLGCGVTAWNYDDAVNILKQQVFKTDSQLSIKRFAEGIGVSTLDKGHIIPNMLPTNFRGVWFPMGYTFL